MCPVENRLPRKVLLAVDGSEHAHAAATLLCDLPPAPGRQVTALAVLIPREASRYAFLESALEQTRLMLAEAGMEVETRLLTGYPAEILAEYAAEYAPDLIAMGAKGLRATLGILLGGVAQQIMEYAACPVLIVRAPYRGLRSVVLVTDGSPPSRKAVDYLARFLLPEGTQVQVLHVLPPLPTPDLITRAWPFGSEVVPPIPTPEMEEMANRQAAEEEREGKAILAETVEALKTGGVAANSTLLRGDAATEIIAYAKTHQVDLIVAGGRGLSRMRGWLLGSLSRKLVHYAPCSVLIVKG